MSNRGRTKGIFFDKEHRDIRLSQFYNDDTLNIFSDASFIGGFYDNKKSGKGKGCYCCIAVCKDNIIDEQIAISSHSTVPESELKGIRRALSFANQYKSQYKFINIFSDSLYSVNAINHYARECYRYSADTANINLILETYHIYRELLDYPNCMVTIFHQSGHIATSSLNSVKEAGAKFMRFNNFRGQNDLNFIRYISTYNDKVDNLSRSYLRQHKDLEIENPIVFNINLLKKDKEAFIYVP